MPNILTNYPNSFYKFVECPVNKCIPTKEFCLPLLDHLPNMSIYIDYDTPPNPEYPIGSTYQFFAMPLPCDLWECSEYIDPSILSTLNDVMATYLTSPYLEKMKWTSGDNPNIFTIEETGEILHEFFADMEMTDKCVCLYMIEAVFAPGFIYQNGSAVPIAKVPLCFEYSQEKPCGVIEFSYSNTDGSFGFPAMLNPYSFCVKGKVWKPIIEGSGTEYIKSNGERLVLNEQLTEAWAFKLNFMQYEQHRAINVALRSQELILTSKAIDQFTGESGYNLYGVMKDNYNFNYTEKCFAGSMGQGLIMNKKLVGSMSYSC